jgi:hypothetical protein
MAEETTSEGSGSEPHATVEEAPAQRVIEAFGGIRPMAAKLEVAVSTVQGWKARGTIPDSRHEDVRAAAHAHGIAFEEADLTADAAEAAVEPEAPESAPEEAASAEPAPRPAAIPEPETPSAPPAARAESTGPGGGWLPAFLAGAIVLAIGAGGAVLTRDLWAPGGADSARLAELDSRLADLEARPTGGEPPSLEGLATVEQVEKVSAALGAQASAIAALEAREPPAPVDISGLEARIGALEAREPPAPVDISGLEARLGDLAARVEAGAEASAELAALRDELAGLSGKLDAAEARLAEADAQIASLAAGEEAVRSDNARRTAAVLALAQLRDRLRGSAPFAAELEAVRALTADDAETAALLDPLAAHAGSGIPSLEGLRRGFAEVARKAVAAGAGASEEGMLGSLFERVSDVVSIRPVGEVEGDGSAAVVARAEVRLDEDNLAGALTELSALDGPAADETAAWRADARARLDAEDAVAKLTGHIGAALSAGG